ncbi:phosphatase PAP2 family protein [soil metagenome]
MRLFSTKILSAEAGPLIVLFLAAALFLIFGHIAEEVIEGDWLAFDRTLISLFRDFANPTHLAGPFWLQEAARDVTSLGSTVVLAAVTVLVTAYLLLAGRKHAAALLLGAVVGGQICSTILKMAIDRPRPDFLVGSPVVYTASFPSGHAMLSAVTYLTLAVLLSRLEPRRALKGYYLGVGILLTVAVGISRVYLGVHWPTDVLAGWCAGAAWAMVCWAAALWVQGRQIRS